MINKNSLLYYHIFKVLFYYLWCQLTYILVIFLNFGLLSVKTWSILLITAGINLISHKLMTYENGGV